MWDQSEQGKIILGGCCIDSESPTHYCDVCKKQFQDIDSIKRWLSDQD